MMNDSISKTLKTFAGSGIFTAASLLLSPALAAQQAPDWKPVQPLMQKYCYECHGGKKTKGETNLKALADDPKVAGNFDLWQKVNDAIANGDMPPEEDTQPSAAEKEQIVKWLGGSLDYAIHVNAGDPGNVTIRRLTNAEYDNTVLALTGVDYGLGKEFLADGGGGEGFSNVGDVLFVSPQQLDKYLVAARKLTDYAAILPGRGIMFQPTRVGLRNPVQLHDQAEQALYIWYQKMAQPFIPKDGEDQREADYMTACWKFKYRDKTGAVSLDQLAAEAKLSPAFLDNWWHLLTEDKPKSRFLDLTRFPWRELPPPDDAKPAEIPAAVSAQVLAIQAQRRSWTNLESKNGWVSTQRRQQDSDGIRPYDMTNTIPKGQPIHLVVGDSGDGNRGDLMVIDRISIKREGKYEGYIPWLKKRMDAARAELPGLESNPTPDTQAIAQRKKWIEDGERTLALFGKHPLEKPIEPESIAVQAPMVIDLPFDEGGLISVKAHLEYSNPDVDFATVQFAVTGDPAPDPTKVIPGALIVWKRQTEASRRTMGDFEKMRSVFPDEYARRLEQIARNYRVTDGSRSGVYYLSDEQLAPLISKSEQQNLVRMKKDWRILGPRDPDQNLQKEWDESLQNHLFDFATKAWRRPVSAEEKTALAAVYTEARSRELDRESSAREVLMRIFITPDFIFRMENAETPGIQPVNAWELASRLSYFLWSSMPDESLRNAAADGSLLKPEVLVAQTKRMLADEKSGALAEEFAGQWLKFYGFSKHSTVDAGKFPEFTPELRAAMHRESQEFFKYIIREDRPVKEILMADYTFLNERLGWFYGIPDIHGDEFRKVNVAEYHRGGILGMGSVLTKTSFPQRTSPVLRGDWLLKSVLGLPTPPPPADVPPFPETTAKVMTVREKLEAHRANKACAVCHDRIDPLGFALEDFDAIGRFRAKDENGLVIDDSGALKDGTKFKGIDGLRSYLGTRDKDFNELLARKLIGYSLGRSIMMSDRLLIGEIGDTLKKSDGKFSAAVLSIVQSKQFLDRRND